MSISTNSRSGPLGAAALLVVAAVAIGACGSPEHGESDASTPAATVRAPIGAAERAEVAQTVELQGVVEAERSSQIAARVAARITAVHVDAGTRVRRGQLLLELDSEAVSGQVAQARGALAQAQSALALAQRNFERFEALAASSSASQLELDQARAQRDRAAGAVEQTEGALRAAESLAGDSRVVAPFAGTVSRRLVDVGDLAMPGRPLVSLEVERVRRLVVAVPETVMARAGLSLGATVPVRLDSRSDLGELEAEVIEISPGADPVGHAFEVKLLLPDDRVPTGSSGRAVVEVERREAVVMPSEALLIRGGLELVVLRTDEGRTSTRAVRIGARLPDGRVEVLSGLDGGEDLLLGLGALPPAGSEVVAESAGEA